MKLSIQSAKLAAAVVIGLAFAGPAAAADPVGNKSTGPDTAADAQRPLGSSNKGMRNSGTNTDTAGNKSSGPDTAADAQKPSGGHKGMHSKAANAANSEYKAAVANCKTMERAERRTCIKEAKATRKTAMRNAHPMGTSMQGYTGGSGTASTPGTAADSKKQDDSFKKKPGG